jgi:hypothetical protein
MNKLGRLMTRMRVFDLDYQDILSKAKELGYDLPSRYNQVTGNALVVTLKSLGIWDKLDVLYVPATSGSSGFATLNWKNPNTFQLTLVNSPTFVANEGFHLAAATSHINTNFNPVTDGVNYTQNNACRFAFVSKCITNNLFPVIDGSLSSTATQRMNNHTSSFHRINSTAGLASPFNYQGGGLKYMARVNPNTIELYTAKSKTTQTVVSDVLFSGTQYIGRNVSTYGNYCCGVYGLGASLGLNLDLLDKCLSEYLTTLGGTFEAEYQALLDRAATLGYQVPSAFCQYMQNLAIKRLKAAGTWSKMDVLYHYSNDCTDSNFATLNWKNPSAFQCTLVNAPVWERYQGLRTNGTSSYIQTNWNPTANGVNYTLNNANVSVRHFTNTAGTALIGLISAATPLSIQSTLTNAQYINSTNLASSNLNLAGAGIRGLSRTSSTNITSHFITSLYLDGTATATQTSTSMPNEAIVIGRTNTSYSAGIVEGFFAGSSFTTAQWNETMQILSSATRF